MITSEAIGSLFPTWSEVPDRMRDCIPVVLDRYLINGELRTWDGPRQKVYSPISVGGKEGPAPQLIGEYPLLSEEAALEALDRAVAAYDHGRGRWPTMTVSERIDHLERFTARMIAVKDRIVPLMMWEVCKSGEDSTREFDRTVKYIQDTIAALKDLDRASSRFEIEEGIFAQIRRGPLGVVLCMGPFNYPLNETFTTLIPALIMGNTVVFKPPKHGVLLYTPLLEAFQEVFPQGVVNIVTGEGRRVIPPLMASGKIDVLALIGTSKTADALKKAHPKPHRLRSVLGLEAKNPAIILPDADLEVAVRECVLGALSFNGQRCTALKILFVHQSIAEEFLARLSLAVGELKFGMPWLDGVFVTPVAEKGKTDRLHDMVEDAQRLGARIVNPDGGTINDSFFYPAILYPVNAQMRVYQEEQFGPIIPVLPFADIAEPIDYVINSDYGQQLSIFGRDAGVIASLIDPLVNQVCRLNINSQCQRGPDTFPFTGRKDSAEGTLSVSDALRVFSIRSLVAARQNATNREIVTDIVRERRSKFLATDFII